MFHHEAGAIVEPHGRGVSNIFYDSGLKKQSGIGSCH